VTVGALSNTGALKVVGVVSFAALPAAMAFLARSLGLGRLAAGIAAILSLLVSSQFGPGLQGLYAVGLVSHQLGAPLFCLALGALLRVPRDTRWRWALLAAVSLAALAITHLISVMILAAVFPLLAFALRREHLGRPALTRFALTPCFGRGARGMVADPRGRASRPAQRGRNVGDAAVRGSHRCDRERANPVPSVHGVDRRRRLDLWARARAPPPVRPRARSDTARLSRPGALGRVTLA
jgi:hypothetical protein